MKKGFSVIEILIVIGIVGVLSAVAVVNFNGSKITKIRQITTNNIVFALEKQKSFAEAGKGGLSQGIKFDENSYTTFSGSSYNASDLTNETLEIDSNIGISVEGATSSVIFSRITGDVGGASTITIYEKNDVTKKTTITIGSLGDISVL